MAVRNNKGFTDEENLERKMISSLLTLLSTGWTPLHHASLSSHHILVKYLLDCGADPDIVDFNGLSAVDLTDDFETVELLTMNSPSAKSFTVEQFNDSLTEYRSPRHSMKQKKIF